MMSESDSSKKYSKRYSLEELEKPILDLLESNSHGLNINQISQQLEINRNTISKWLKTLEAKNKIISRKTGVSNLYYKAEKKANILAGPYFITVEHQNDKYFIKQANIMYLDRINEINESLIGSELFNFFPFNNHKRILNLFLQNALSSLKTEKDIFEDKIDLRSYDDTIESFIFKITTFPNKPNQYIIEFLDLTLSKLQEDQLVNSTTFQLILDQFKDAYVSIQTSDGKILLTNKNVIKDFNNDVPLSAEPVFCYDLFRNRSSLCDHCIGVEAIRKDKPQQETYDMLGKTFIIDTIPIKSTELDLKGYIFIARKKE